MDIKMIELWTDWPIGLYTLTKKADADADLPDTMKRPYIAQVITLMFYMILKKQRRNYNTYLAL